MSDNLKPIGCDEQLDGGYTCGRFHSDGKFALCVDCAARAGICESEPADTDEPDDPKPPPRGGYF